MNIPESLSAKYKGTFAYSTIKDRLPQILTKAIDSLHRYVTDIKDQFGEAGKEDALYVIGELAKLRNEMMTDKPLTLLNDQLSDCKEWNRKLSKYKEEIAAEVSWFTSAWLFVECYLYRRVASIISNSKYLKDYDVFGIQKNEALTKSMGAVQNLATFFSHISQQLDGAKEENLKKYFFDLMQISLWGNKCDLSLSGGDTNAQEEHDIHENLEEFKPLLLVDDLQLIWDKLSALKSEDNKTTIDIVLDNSGYELYTDLVLAEFLLSSGLADRIRIHPKLIPWFVSDVNPSDLEWTLGYLTSCGHKSTADLATKWQSRVDAGTFEIVTDPELTLFWTQPESFCHMRDDYRQLWDTLSASSLIIFKGDLNYRKLAGDLKWPHVTPFKTALRGFTPSAICSLRTLKADLVVGLNEGQADQVEAVDNDWMVTGKYAVIQSCLQ